MNVEEFIKYYSLEASELPVEYIESFLEEYKLEQKDLSRFKWDLYLQNAFNDGRTFGHDIGKLLRVNDSSKDFEECIKEANLLVLSIDLYNGDELARPVFAVADFKTHNLYYSENDIMDDYTKADKIISISAADEAEIQNGFIKTVKADLAEGYKANEPDYNFRIFAFTKDNEVKRILGSVSDTDAFPGFDAFIKKLYKEKFDI